MEENSVKNVTVNLFPCAHCKGEGTCRNGKDGLSCSVCLKEHKVKEESYGVVCSVCGGIGLVETKTDRINKRTIPILAIVIVYAALCLVVLSMVSKSDFFNEILAFSGYYFSSRK